MSDSAFGSTAFTSVVVDGQTNTFSGPSPSIEVSAGATRVDSTGAWTQSVSTLVITVEPQVTPRKLAMLFAMLLAVLGIAYFFFIRKDRNEHQMA